MTKLRFAEVRCAPEAHHVRKQVLSHNRGRGLATENQDWDQQSRGDSNFSGAGRVFTSPSPHLFNVRSRPATDFEREFQHRFLS